MLARNRLYARLRNYQYEWLLVVLEMALTVWTYYAYVVLICVQTVQHRVEAAILLPTYHVLFLMTLWSYLRTLLTPRLPVPQEFHMDEIMWQLVDTDPRLQKETRERLRVKTTTCFRGTVYTLNYCYLCHLIKPDRCHHCSRCKACVLRMDHHCPWVNRCVGFHNHKYFILFLHYTFAYSVFLIITCTGVLPRLWRRDWVGWASDAGERGRLGDGRASSAPSNLTDTLKPTESAATGGVLVAGTGLSPAFIQIAVLILIYVTVVVSLTPLLHMHAQLLAGNITTLEWSRPLGLPGETCNLKTFDTGSVSGNMEQIMGPDRRLWAFPVFTSPGDGVHFPVRKGGDSDWSTDGTNRGGPS